MTDKFDAKAEARLIDKLLKLADEASTRTGGSIVAQRLIDYASDELRALSSAQLSEVLSLIDSKLEKSLLRDGHGNVHGFVYSRSIYVSLKGHVASASDGNMPRVFASLRTAAAPKRGTRRIGAKKSASSNESESESVNGSESDSKSKKSKSSKTSGKRAAAKRSSSAAK